MALISIFDPVPGVSQAQQPDPSKATPSRQEGFSVLDFPEAAPPPAQPAQPAQPEVASGLLGNLGAGVERGLLQVPALGHAAAGTVGELFGADEFVTEQVDKFDEIMAQIEAKPQAEVPRVEDIEDLGDFALFAAAKLGEQVPILAGVLAAGVGGAGLAGAAGSILTRLVAKRAITEAGKRALMQKGFLAGTFAGAATLETGGIASEQLEEGLGLQPGPALLGGAAAGAFEIVTPLTIASRFGLGPKAVRRFADDLFEAFESKGVLTRVAGGLAGVGLAEATTETAQEAIALAARKFVDRDFDLVGPEAMSRLLNSAAAGFVVGGTIGGITVPFTTGGKPSVEEGDVVTPDLVKKHNTGAVDKPDDEIKVEAEPEPTVSPGPPPTDPIQQDVFEENASPELNEAELIEATAAILDESGLTHSDAATYSLAKGFVQGTEKQRDQLILEFIEQAGDEAPVAALRAIPLLASATEGPTVLAEPAPREQTGVEFEAPEVTDRLRTLKAALSKPAEKIADLLDRVEQIAAALPEITNEDFEKLGLNPMVAYRLFQQDPPVSSDLDFTATARYGDIELDDVGAVSGSLPRSAKIRTVKDFVARAPLGSHAFVGFEGTAGKRALKKQAQLLARALGSKQRIIFSADPRIDASYGGSVLGRQVRIGVDTHVIQVNVPDTTQTKRDYGALLNTLHHEIGHAIIDHLYHSASPEVKAALAKAWRNWVFDMLNSRRDDAITNVHGAATGVIYAGAYTDKVIDMIKTDLDHGGTAEADYWGYALSFREFLARQTALFMEARQSDVKYIKLNELITTWFKKVVSALRKWWTEAVGTAERDPKRVDAAFKSWMESLIISGLHYHNAPLEPTGAPTWQDTGGNVARGPENRRDPVEALLDNSKYTFRILEKIQLSNKATPARVRQVLAEINATKQEMVVAEAALAQFNGDFTWGEFVRELEKYIFPLEGKVTHRHASYGLSRIGVVIGALPGRALPQTRIWELPFTHSLWHHFQKTAMEQNFAELTAEEVADLDPNDFDALDVQEEFNVTAIPQDEIQESMRNSSTDSYAGHVRSFDRDGILHLVEVQSDLQSEVRQLVAGQGSMYKPGEVAQGLGIFFQPKDDRGTLTELSDRERGQAMIQMADKMLERLVREEHRTAALNGEHKLRLATAETVAIAEGWASDALRIINPRTSMIERVTWENADRLLDDIRKDTRRVREELTAMRMRVERDEEFDLIIREHETALVLNQDRIDLIQEQKKNGFKTRVSFNQLDPSHRVLFNKYRALEKFVKRNYGAKRVDDENGFSWMEWKVPIEAGSTRIPINANALPAAGVLKSFETAASAAEKKVIKKSSAALDKYSWYSRLFETLTQVIKNNLHIPGVPEYGEAVDAWHALRTRWHERANQRIRDWNAIGKDQGQRLGRFVQELGQLDSWPSVDKFTELATKHGLKESGMQVYLKLKADFDAVLDEVQAALERDAEKTFGDPAQVSRAKAKLRAEFKAMRDKPYFPLLRFGQHTVVVRALKDVVVEGRTFKAGSVVRMEAFETDKIKQRRMGELTKRFKEADGFSVFGDFLEEEVMGMRGLPAPMLRLLKQRLKLTDEQEAQLEQLEHEVAPGQSFKKRFLKRDNVPGFDMDAMRSYADYMWHGANHLARITHQDDMQDAIHQVHESANTLRKKYGVDVAKRRKIHQHLNEHYDYIMKPENDWANLRAAGFLWYLGFLPKSAFVNLTQVPLVALPYMSANLGGEPAVVKELALAYKDALKAFSLKPEQWDEGEFSLISDAINEGWIDESQATELGAVAMGGLLSRTLAGTPLQRGIRDMSWWGAWMFRQAERSNRRVVALAAYRLAKQRVLSGKVDLESKDAKDLIVRLRMSLPKQFRLRAEKREASLIQGGMEPTEAKLVARAESAAFLVAKDSVRSTQYEYARWNRPGFMRGKRSVVFLFYQYIQNTIWFATHEQGRIRFLAMLLLFAGLQGLPGAEDAAALYRLFMRKVFGKDVDVWREAREFLVETGANPDLFLHGISRNSFGLHQVGELTGIPIPNVDLSGSISLGRVIPGVEALGPPGDTGDKFMRVSTDVGGAAIAIPIAMVQALSDEGNPDLFKRWERAFPSALRGLSRAARFQSEGRERTGRDATVLEFNTEDPYEQAEIIAQSLGFIPTRLAQKWDMIRMQQEAQRFWSIQHQMLLRAWDHAKEMNDREGIADARKAIRRFNKSVPHPELRITFEQLKSSLKSRERARRYREQGRPSAQKLIPEFQRIERLFPEVEESEETI